MEPYFQHTRYASRPQTQPQLQHHHQPHPRHFFSNNPNMYTPHHSSLHALSPPLHRSQGPPPPQPPPSSLQSFQPVRTPPPFNPQNSQFTYNNNNHNHPNSFNPNHRPRSDLHNFIESPRIIHQRPFDDDRLPDYNLDNRSDLKDPSRVLPDMWPGRQYIPANIDPESHRRQSNNRPLSPMKTKHGLGCNSMFTEEQEILLSRGDDNYHRRNQFVSTTSDRSSRDFRLVSIQMNHSSPYENLRGGSSYDDGLSDNQRWVLDREVIRDPFIDRGSNEIGDLDANRIGSGKREHYRGREVNAEFERHSNKGSREGSNEFSRTPRKPPQKKSVLLRIQKPNYRNREDDRVHYPGNFDDTKSSFRGKDQNLYTDRDIEEQKREGSPVELDVSFKSNSLVAKAIVTPASNFAGVSDSNLAPRNEKVRKVLVLNKGSSSSPLIKPNEGTAKLDNSSVANYTFRSDNSLKQSEEEVTVSVIDDVHNRSSMPGSTGAKVSYARNKTGSSAKGAVSNEGETNVVSGKISSLKVAKKKKIVKRVVKKVVNPNLSSSSSQPTEECNKPVIAASSEPEKDAALTSVDIVDSKPCSNETTVMPENDGVDGIVTAIAPENGMSDDSGLLCVPNIKRKRNDSTSPSGSSSHEETKINENMVHGTYPKYLRSISYTDKDCTKLQNETTSLDVDSVENANKQLFQNRDLSLPENNVDNGSPKVLLSTECNANFCFSSPEKNKIHEFPTSSCNMTLGCEPDNGLINSPERIKDFDSQTTDVGSKQPSPVENGIVDQFQNPSFSVGSSKSCWQSNLGEMAIQNAATCASCSSERVGTVVSSEGGPTVSGKINFSSHGTNDDIHKQPSPNVVTISLENGLEGSPNYMFSMGGSKEDTPNIKKSKQKLETPLLDLSKSESEVDDMYLEPVNMVNSACWVDTTLRLSFKDATPSEFTVSGDGHGNVGLQPCIDGVSAFPQRSSMGVAEENASVSNTTNGGSNGTSPKNTRKRKFSDSQLELTCLIASDVKEGPETASGVKASSNSFNGLTQSKAEARLPALDPLCASVSRSSQREITASLHTAGGYENTAASLKDAIEDDGLRDVHSCLAAEELEVPKVQSLCLLGLEGEHVADAGSIIQNNSIHMVSNEMKKMDVDAEQANVDNGTTQCQFPPELQSPDLDERLPSMDVEYDSCRYVKNDLPSLSNYLSSLRDGNGVSTTNSSDEVMRLVPDTLSDMDYLETLPDVPNTSYSQLSLEKVGGDNEMLHGKPAIQGGYIISAVTSSSPDTENSLNLDSGVENDHSFSGKTGPLSSQISRNSTQMLNAISGEISNGRKNLPTHAVSRTYPGRSSFGLTAKNTASSTHNSKSRTWHRTDNSPGIKAFSSTVPTQRQLPKKITKLPSTSYIRKGNSLVRKPTVVTSQSQRSHGLSSSAYRLNSLDTDEVKKNARLDTRTDVVDPPNFVRTGVNDSFERLRTPPLPCATKMPNHATDSLGDLVSSTPAEPLQNYATETASDPITSAESNDLLKSSEDVIKIAENPMIQTDHINIFDCNNETNNGNVVSSNGNSVTYVKRKSNQLVATSNPCSFSANNAHNSMSIPSDGYYKRRKNQLIRTSLESQVKPTVTVLDESVDSEGKTLHGISSSRSLSKRRLRKVISKTGKESKFSLVWTLRSSQLSNDSGNSLHRQKVLPHLFPWKRATYWRSFMPNSAANSSNSTSSTIRKLMLLRKRDTVYTRSKHGFSLRKSKVLSVGGSSLKWSKSIEKQSKKANEEATLAVAEAERKKREQSGAPHVSSGTNDKNSCRKSVNSIKLHPGERIFRIGSVRYKMDSSRRTLQRISDDESSNSAALQTEKDAKRSYVPRRLVIGKDEYVRIGNGNQLIRDPKKRTRILASEKVRWSLHTARSRLARKRKYCQFFTRFGKCNKDDGKCPYIHDSSKIAVCTKFLNGLCFNLDCKLTHKVIPERMPDCSYFLQGLCTNKNCPYRHVHVNPDAPTCEGFLRGYCADGNECQKKHSYVCPTYEATGSCPKGSKCKLHHPKKRSKGKKSKQSREKKKALGRYFGSMNINVSEPGIAESEKHSVQENDNICLEGSIADYISLDVTGEAGENINPVDEQTSLSDSDPSELQLVELDELIIPIRIMNI